VEGTEGTLRALNPIAPQLWHRLEVRGRAGRHVERLRSEGSYTHQLRAFRDAVLHGTPFPTHPADAVANMRALDAIYEASGLGRR
jgi:predicted dehydrogenase